MVRDQLRAVGRSARGAVTRGATRGKRGIVYFVTSDKNIQAVKTAAAFGVIGSSVQALADTLNIAMAATIGVRIPVSWLALVGMIGVFWVADFADENTDEWRALVEEATGEAAADDDAEGQESAP